MKAKSISLLVMAIIAFILPQVVSAQTHMDEKALKLVAQFSAEVCGKYETASIATRIEVNGGLQAKITGLLKGLVSGGFGTEAKYTRDDSNGVLQKDLATLNITRINCREKVVGLVLNNLQSPTTLPNTKNKLETKNANPQIFTSKERESPEAHASDANRIYQRSEGANSPNIVGDNNKLTFNTPPAARQLTSEQNDRFRSFINDLPPQIKMNVRTVLSLEAQNYASQFHRVVIGSGRSELEHVPIDVYNESLPKGVFAVTLSGDDETARYRNLLVQQLHAVKVSVIPANNSKVPEGVINIIVSENPGTE